MPQRRLALWAALAAVFGLASWRLLPGPSAPAPAAPPGARAARRVVTGSPALTEMVFALGGADRLVGVSEFSTFPPQAREIPSVGAFLNPNLELIARLKPDLVVFQGDHEKLREYCRAHGQPFVGLPLDSVADVFRALTRLGQELGLQRAAALQIAAIERDFAQVKQAVSSEPPARVFISVGRSMGGLGQLTTCGPHTFLHELVTLAGGENLFADAQALYPAPSLEVLTQRAPDVILDLQPDAQRDVATLAQLRAQWSGLPTVPAVRQGRIEVVTEDYAMIPATRMGQLAKRLARALHPSRVKLLQ